MKTSYALPHERFAVTAEKASDYHRRRCGYAGCTARFPSFRMPGGRWFCFAHIEKGDDGLLRGRE